MKVIHHRLPEFEQLQILPLADLHIGDIHADGKKIQEWITYIGETDNCYTIFNGDLMNTATKNSLSFDYSGLTPMNELEQCVKLLTPIRSKCLCITGGNHERRISRDTSIDTTFLLAEQLGIIDRYAPESALLFVQFGKQSTFKHSQPMLYTIYCTHGSGGGRKEGGKINRLVDLANIVDADCYIHSHTHLPLIAKNAYYRTNTRHCTVSKVDRLFLNTSSSLEYGGYGEVASMKPNSLETPLILLNGKKREMKAIL